MSAGGDEGRRKVHAPIATTHTATAAAGHSHAGRAGAAWGAVALLGATDAGAGAGAGVTAGAALDTAARARTPESDCRRSNVSASRTSAIV